MSRGKYQAFLLALLFATSTALTLPWRSAATPATSAKQGLKTVIEELAWVEESSPDFVLLSVAQQHAASLKDLCAEAASALNAKTLIGVVGTGVIGGQRELDERGEGGISILAGSLPNATQVNPIVVTKDSFPVWSELLACGNHTGFSNLGLLSLD